MANWSALPQEILHSISQCIDNPFDLIHFRSVCSSWRSSGVPRFRPIPPLRCPFPRQYNCEGDCHVLRCRVYLFKSNCVRAQYWMLKLEEKENGQLVRQNLFLRNRSYYELKSVYPSLLLDLLNCQVIELAQEHVGLFTYLWDPPSSVSMATFEERIAFMQLGAKNDKFMVLGKHLTERLPMMYSSVAKKWTKLGMKPDSLFEGLVSFKGKFYGIDYSAGVTTVVEPSLQVTTFQRSRPSEKDMKRWLVKSVEKLLLVESVERYSNIGEKELSFVILELDEERNDWYEVQHVGGHVLFLDEFGSFMCLATQIPGFRPNSIIFSGTWNRHNTILVFDIENQVFGPFAYFPDYTELLKSPPGWVISNA